MAQPESLEYLPSGTFNHLGIISLGTLALGAVSTLYHYELSAARTGRKLYDGKPKVIDRPSDDGDHAIIVRLGFRQDPDDVSDMLDGHLELFGSRYYVKSSPNDEANKEARLKIAEAERGRDIIVLGISKGGKDEAHEYTDAEYMEEHGPISLLGMDSSPLHRRHIRGGGRAALYGARFLPPMRTAASIYASHTQAKEIVEQTDLASARQMRAYLHAKARLEFYAAKKEIPSLLRSLPNDGSLERGMDKRRIGRIIYLSSPFDATIDTTSAYEWLRENSGRDDIQHVVDDSRPHGNHAGAAEFPDRLVTELRRHIADDHDTNLLQTVA